MEKRNLVARVRESITLVPGYFYRHHGSSLAPVDENEVVTRKIPTAPVELWGNVSIRRDRFRLYDVSWLDVARLISIHKTLIVLLELLTHQQPRAV